jgi:gluconokinase
VAGLSPPLVLALDVGSSSVRALLFDGRGRPCPEAGSRLAYTIDHDAEGAAEVDAERLLRLTEAAVDRAVRGRGGPVAAVGLSTFWHGLVGVDAAGAPTTPVILWSDTRAWREAERLRRELDPEDVRRRTGAPIHPCYWPAKLAWLRRDRPEVWRRTHHWLSFSDLLYLRLFGRLGTSPSMASGTGLRRLAGGWDPELLERLDLSPDSLPDEVGTMSGLRPAYARRWPRLRDARWLTGRGDGALANLGSGCLDPGRRAITLGTSGALRVVTHRPPPDLAPGLWCYLLDAERYVVGGALSDGGNLWAWMERTLRLEARGLERRLRRLRPGSGPDFLPLLAGERSPGFATRATGAIAGLTQATTAEHIARSAMEGVAVRFAMIDAALDRSVPGAALLVASGGALHASRLWAQIVADAVGKPISVSPDFEASTRGAALLALASLGVPVHVVPRRGRLVVPDEEAHRRYAEVAARQERLYSLLVRPPDDGR